MTLRNLYQEALNEVTALRDNARVQAHLFSLDARERWGQIERALESAQIDAEREGEQAIESALSTLRKAAEVAQQLIRERAKDSSDLNVPVQEVMKQSPKTCGPLDPLNRAAQLMWEADCGSIPIVDEEGRVLGMLTDRDIAIAAYTTGRALAEIPTHKAMSKRVVTMGADGSVGKAMALMTSNQLRRIPVVSEDGQLAGIVSMADIARHLVASEENEACRSLTRTLAAISSAASPS